METKGKFVANVSAVNFDDSKNRGQAFVTLKMLRKDAAELLNTGVNAWFTFQFEPFEAKKDKAEQRQGMTGGSQEGWVIA